MRNVGVRHEGEKKERRFQNELLCGEVRVQKRVLSIQNKTTNEMESKETSAAFIPDTTEFVP